MIEDIWLMHYVRVDVLIGKSTRNSNHQYRETMSRVEGRRFVNAN